MNLCDDGHEEVCYAKGTCPVCAMREERDEAQGEVDWKQGRIEELKDVISDLKSEAKDLHAEIATLSKE